MLILLVEDTPEQAQIVECYLEIAIPGVQVIVANSLAQALNELVENQIDAVLLDLGLPDSQGITTVIEIQKADSETPKVVLTSAGEDGLGVLCLQAGAQDFLDKVSVTPQSLARAIVFATTRKGEEINLCMQREIDALCVVNPIETRSFEKPELDDYREYLKRSDASPAAASQVIRKLLLQGVKSEDFLSLHTCALKSLSHEMEPDKLRHIVAKSSYLALSVMTLLTKIHKRNRTKART